MTNTHGTRAWRFLKPNPQYVEEWTAVADGLPATQAGPIPMRRQTEADLNAARWGLLAWQDPLAEDGTKSPFWTDVAMLEALPAPETPPLSELLSAPGVRLSGLRLLDGAVVVKVEQGEAAVQLRIAEAFEPEDGVALRLPVDLDLSVRLRRAADLWPIAGAETKKENAHGASPTTSCLPPWIASSAA